MTSSLFDALNQTTKKLSEARALALAQAKETFAPALKEFMTLHPEIAQLRWTQYRPYFNDGEACLFSVHELEFLPVGNDPNGETDEEVDDTEADWFTTWSDKPPEGVSATTYQAVRDLSAMIQGNDELLEAVFGDHCRVIVTPDDVTVEEYSHD